MGLPVQPAQMLLRIVGVLWIAFGGIVWYIGIRLYLAGRKSFASTPEEE